MNRRTASALCLAALVAGAFLAASVPAEAEPQVTLPSLEVRLTDGAQGMRASSVIEIVGLLTLIGLAPSLLILLTCFTRILVSLAILRQALGLQQIPANQILVGLSLFLTFFVMEPVWAEVNEKAVQPYLAEKITVREGMDRALAPIRQFMLAQTRSKDLGLFLDLGHLDIPESRENVPLRALLPAFLISELKTAFMIGFLLYIPFLVLDLVVGAILLAMGMMVLPPVVISLPFKLLLFVMVDGWSLVIESLVRGFA